MPSTPPVETETDGTTVQTEGAGRDRTGEAPDDDPAAQQSAAETTAETDDRIANPQQLTEALMARNPGFDGQNMGIQPINAELLGLGINDPAVKDISPLRKQRIGMLDLRFCDITDLGPLEGMPIVELYLEDNKRLRDLDALRGMPLQKIYLSNTAVENLGPLRGAPLSELNAVGSEIKDLSPLSECPLQMIWLTDCPVSDISPLAKTPMVSLTLENTPVEDISSLAGHAIQRLHIGGTKVTDLTPVGQMHLTRLIFTPSRIKKGLEVVRELSIGELGTNFDNRMPPAEFWQKYDAGELD